MQNDMLRSKLARWGLLSALLVPAVVPALVLAQEPPAQVYRLEPKPMEGIEHGKAVVVKGEVGPQPHRFVVDGLNMNMPVVVLLRSVRADDAVDIKLTKYAWNQPLRAGQATGEPLSFKFRTEGEFQLGVSSQAADTPYRLLVWVGEEVEPELRPVVVKASEFQEADEDGGSGSPALWGLAAALVAGVAVLGVLVFRRNLS